MNLEQIKEKLKTSEYDFLRNDERIKDKLMVLTLGGSHAYGMDTENSDLDVRGVALNTKEEILLGTDFYDLLNDYEKRFEYAKKNTALPDVPDTKKINEFKIYINEQQVKGMI